MTTPAVTAALVAAFTNPTTEQIVADPTPFGLEWRFGPLSHKDMQLTERAPYLAPLGSVTAAEALERMRKAFGDDQVKSWIGNSSSLKVECQKVRTDIYEDRSLLKPGNEIALKTAVVGYAFGRKARQRRVTIVEKRIYLANDGTEFGTPQEALAHNVDLQLAQQAE